MIKTTYHKILNYFSKEKYYYIVNKDDYIITYSVINNYQKYFDVIIKNNIFEYVEKNNLKLRIYNIDNIDNKKGYCREVYFYGLSSKSIDKLNYEPEFYGTNKKMFVCKIECKNKQDLAKLKMFF